MKCYGDAEVGCCSIGVLHYYGTAVLWCCSVVCDDVWLLLCHCCDVIVSLISLNGCFSVSESMSVTYIQTTPSRKLKSKNFRDYRRVIHH